MMDYAERAHTILGTTMKDTEADYVLLALREISIVKLTELLFCLAMLEGDEK